MNLLTLEEEKIKTEKIKGYEFKFRFISPKDRIKITRQRIAITGPIPIESFMEDEFMLYQYAAIVDTCLEEMPEDFNQNESCIEWPDRDLIIQLAKAIQKHTDDIEAKLKKNKPAT